MSKNTGTSELINYFTLGGSGDVGIGGNLTLSTIVNATVDTDRFLVSDSGVIKYRTGAELLSDLGVAGSFVPYTGATSAVDLGTNDLTSRYVIANGSPALGGVISMKQDAAYVAKGNGYSSIASSFNSFDFFGYTGASTYKNFQLRFDGLTNNTLRTYTLPDADGTIALTSSLSGYLPLSGGTLTGALNGTSATMSGLVTGGTGLRATGGTDAGSQLSLFANGSGNTFIAGFDINFNTGSNNARTTCLTLASTGAATFSSSVTAAQFITGGTPSNTAGFTNSFYAESAFPSLTLSNTGGNTGKYTFGVTAGALGIWNNATSAYEIFIDPISSGQIQMNRAVRINADGQSLLIFPTTTNSVRMQIQSTGGGNLVLGTENSTGGNLATGTNAYASVFTSGSTRDLVLGTNSTARLTINGTSGNVGIGTPNPDSGLTIDVTSTIFNALSLRDTRAFNQSPEAALAFRTKFNSAGAFATPALLVAYKDNATDGNQAGGIAVYTNANAGPVERMRINSDGYLKLHRSRFLGDSDICYIDLYNPNTGNLSIVNTSSNSTYGNIILSTNNTQRMRITLDGTIAFNGNSTPNSGGLDKMSLGFADGAYGWIQTWGGRALSLNSQGNNVLIGTTTDNGNRLQVSGVAQASNFITDSGTASILTFSVGYSVFYTCPSNQNAIYLVTLQLNGFSNYTAYATICQNNNDLVIMNQVNNVAYIRVSGLNIEGSQNSGSTQSMRWRIIKIGQ